MKKLLAVLSLSLIGLTVLAHDDRPTFDLKAPATQSNPTVFEGCNTAATVVAQFSSAGELLKLNGVDVTVPNGFFTIIRDKKGRIQSIVCEEGEGEKEVVYKYDSKDRVIGYTVYWLNPDTDIKTKGWDVTRSLNKDGQVTQERFVSPDGPRLNYTYDIKETDSNGNWVSRLVSEPSQKLSDYQESRSISYDFVETPESLSQTVQNSDYSDNYKVRNGMAPWLKRIIQILGSILLLALFGAMIYHCIYEIWLKKPVYVTQTVDSFRSLRSASGKPGDSTEDENAQLAALIDKTLSENLQTLTIDGNEIVTPTRRKHFENIKAAISEVMETMPTDADVVDKYNLAVKFLGMEKRVFAGSRRYLTCGIVVILLISLIFAISEGVWYGPFAVIPYCGLYWLFSHRRVAYLAKSMSIYGSKDKDRGLLSGFLADIVGEINSTYKYYDKYGNELTVGSDPRATRAFLDMVMPRWIFAVAAYVIAPVFMPYIGIYNYVRFFLLER